MFPWRIDCLAQCDVTEAHRYYERRREGLGRRFANAVHATIHRVASQPELHRKIRGSLRKCRVPDFPYAVIYHFDGAEVIVLAVANLYRDPQSWMKRLSEDA
jgi:hypothetical protein